jgi:hypothetical protein
VPICRDVRTPYAPPLRSALRENRLVERFIRSGEDANARILRTSLRTSKALRWTVRIELVAATYYSRRSARDPDWREKQTDARRERERRQREEDPNGSASSAAVRTRTVARDARADGPCASSRTLRKLLERVGGDPATLRIILREEIERGVIEYHSTSRRYVLNGGLPEDVKAALREIRL